MFAVVVAVSVRVIVVVIGASAVGVSRGDDACLSTKFSSCPLERSVSG